MKINGILGRHITNNIFGKIKMKLFLFIFLLSFLSSASTKTMEITEGFDAQPNGIHTLSYRSFCNFIRDRISGAYYTTSVSGHSSQMLPLSEFLKKMLSNGWNVGTFQCDTKTLPSKGDEEYKYYDTLSQDCFNFFEKILNLSSDQSVDDMQLIGHSSTFEYLYREDENLVSIIPLIKREKIDFALRHAKNHLTLDQLSENLAKIDQADQILYDEEVIVTKKIYDIGVQIIRLKSGNPLYCSSSNLETEKNIENLEAEKKDIRAFLDNIRTQRQEKRDSSVELTNEMQKRMPCLISGSWFKCSTNSSDTQKCLINILEKFRNKSIEIFTLSRNQEGVLSNIADQLIAALSSDSQSLAGHLFYTKINIDAHRQSMKVMVVDPTFDPDQPYVKAVFGSSSPLPTKTLHLFSEIAESVGLKLDHSYHYRGDQIINMHDCGRISTIYLLSELNGRNALELSNYDIYKGFKMLEANDYDLIHQTATATYINPKVQSRFSYYITGPLRISCDFILNSFYG